jgi:predicted nucleic acid-binding protein
MRTRDTKPFRAFFDTNILLYSNDKRNPAKQLKAHSLVLAHRSDRTGVVSLQVLQEYFVNATRKLGMDPVVARRRLEIFSRFDLVEPRLNDVLAAIDLHRLNQISYWDALIVHCARMSGCHVVLTEDLQDGQVIDGVRIVNPFL